ncbi:MAG: hypothetical protein JXR46_05480 [Calditrichaceae bacterium]|nr:hypothetical protein [Calditrichaceae bacterium]
MIHRLNTTVLFTLLGLSHIFFSYYFFGGWWNSSVGTILILLFSYLIWNKDFLKHTGLQLDFKTIARSIILAGIIAICALLIMKYIAAEHDVVISYTSWRDYYHDIFYILNEEIVIGSILLFALVNKRKFNPLTASVGLAVFFALIHFVFYKWIFNDKGILGVLTLTTLFLVGFVRNSLILQTGHIGYSWALHFGWMIIMFGSSHIYSNTTLRVTEPERFNLYLGSIEMLIISIIMAGLSLLYWIKKHRLHTLFSAKSCPAA